MNQYGPYDFTIQFDDLGPIYIDANQDISFCSSYMKYTAKYSLIISQSKPYFPFPRLGYWCLKLNYNYSIYNAGILLFWYYLGGDFRWNLTKIQRFHYRRFNLKMSGKWWSFVSNLMYWYYSGLHDTRLGFATPKKLYIIIFIQSF